MSSAQNRGQLVADALSLAGRGSELKSSCNFWMNYWLRDLGLTYRFPELRKQGSVITLPQGSVTAPLPADFGAGMAKMGMIFGPDNKPLEELEYEEFANSQGDPIPNSTGRPKRYMIDRQAGVYRFDMTADQAYSFTPTYYMMPPILNESTAYDNQPIWLDNDMLAIEGLKWYIYVFKEDDREAAQEARVQKILIRWERDRVKLGGSSRIQLSPSKFKGTSYRGFGGFMGP